MITFFVSLGVLLIGYLVYGKIAEKIFSPDERETPAYTNHDGVDCVPMKTWKVFLVQLLNIAGTGPIFGALMGATFGPVVFFWIVFGSILGGAVHDYMSGMISCRHVGGSIAEIAGLYLGRPIKWIIRFFSVVLLVLVGTVFITSPAELIARLTPSFMNTTFWIVVILIYYILAAVVPIDKLIGKVYPVFGVILLVMAVGITGGLIFKGYTIPEARFFSIHPSRLPAWPFMFVTVACGAISGFHATQSPMVAKCIKSEKMGRRVFYGAMIAEAVIALIWAAAGMAFYGSTGTLNGALTANGQSGTVYEISKGLLGFVGGVLAIAGVVICPISSGDTAFRSARLILAEWTGLEQRHIRNRYIITLPLLVVGALLTQLDFDVLWRYFSWSNQTLAMITLWCATAYLVKKGKYCWGSLLTALPATFMSAVSMTYILMSQEGFRLSAKIAYPIGFVYAIGLFVFYIIWYHKKKNLGGIQS